MGVFDNILHADQTLFKNIDALDFDFIPKIIPYREEEQRRIASSIQPLFSQRNGKNVVICGTPGAGKTVACRHVFRELEEKSEDIIPIYINCWKRNTSYKVALEICHQLGYAFTQNKKTDELFREIVRILNKKNVVFAFDEIDKADDYDFLYVLSEEIYRKALIMITNFRTFLEDMDERVKSRIMPELIEFKPYTLEETRGILKQRVEYAFFEGVWESDAFTLVVEKSASMQDIRSGIHLLKDSADAAESKASKKITKEHAQKAISKVDELGALKSTDLKEDDKVILGIIKKHSKSKIGDLYKLYENAGGKGAYKTFQRKMKSFQDQGFVTLKKSQGEGGNTTIVEYKERTKSLSEF